MKRYAWVWELKPEAIPQYVEWHQRDRVWPGVLDATKRAGIGNYTIFLFGNQLFFYFECPDIQKAWAVMGADEAFKRWQVQMDPYFAHSPGRRDGDIPLLEEVFHLD